MIIPVNDVFPMRIAPRLNIVVRPDPHNAGGRGLLEATVCIFQ